MGATVVTVDSVERMGWEMDRLNDQTFKERAGVLLSTFLGLE